MHYEILRVRGDGDRQSELREIKEAALNRFYYIVSCRYDDISVTLKEWDDKETGKVLASFHNYEEESN